VILRSKALAPSDSLGFYMLSGKSRWNQFQSLIILILTRASCRTRGICSTGFLPSGGEIIAGKGGSDFFTFRLTLVFGISLLEPI